MKVEGTRTSRVGVAGRAGSAKRGNASAAPSSSHQVQDSTAVMGIPEAELTPKVRMAIMSLMEEVARLREELNNSRGRVQHLERLADQDSLVPVYNRRAFVRELTRAISMTERYGAPSTVIYFDVNNMKQINDSFGHPAGDAALRHVADTLLEQVRDSDIVGRLGGDEFGVILYQIDAQVAHDKSIQLAHEIAKERVSFNDEELEINVTFGAYTFNGVEDAGQALAEADKAMYASKQGGLRAKAQQ
ncbi:MAG: GGDEF domain-containing protein [Alphaproteobacteria bacterium]|jgi:diguanylate cyclase (GGDEF)-like protein|nr:GGDEF domain-containing protein [Alphaproteobacteria bacterium]